EHTVVRAPVLPRGTSSGVGALAPAGARGGPRARLLVLDRKVSLGQVIGPPLSGHLVTLAADLSAVHVEAQVAEGDVARVVPGLTAELTVPSADGDVQMRGKVTEVRLLPTTEHGAVFYKVIIEARNEHDPATRR